MVGATWSCGGEEKIKFICVVEKSGGFPDFYYENIFTSAVH